MDNKIIIQLIKREINELNLLVDALENTNGSQDILIDVTTSKVETLSEVVSFLHKDNNNDPLPNKDRLSPDKKSDEEIIQSLVEKQAEQQNSDALAATTEEEKPVNEAETQPEQPDKSEELNTPVPEMPDMEVKTEEEHLNNTPAQPEETTANKESKVTQEKVLMEEKTTTTKDNNKAYKKVLGDQFIQEKSLNEKFTSLTDNKYKVMGKPVTSVKKAIGLNDRFMFTRELFNNDSGKFNNTVEAIDNASDLVEAVEYLEKNYEWQKTETSLKFMELVKRRFNN
ncbi:MAG: hypothetical protein PF486_08450 [Prolixibacteraceae bacterium]|jgi:hypothetical protein|nr:hypothetical protein [Prolixibacteraceae bacterium]